MVVAPIEVVLAELGALIADGVLRRASSPPGREGGAREGGARNLVKIGVGASFGAYSATKAASHQLGRIASLEFAPLGVRVNMVAPDAVFSHGDKRSGLWATVGPGRMKARGLDERGLEEYYPVDSGLPDATPR